MPIIQLNDFIKVHKVSRLDLLNESLRQQVLQVPVAGAGAITYAHDNDYLVAHYFPDRSTYGGTIQLIAEVQGVDTAPFVMCVEAVFRKGSRDAPFANDGDYVAGMCPTAFDYDYYPIDFSIAAYPEHIISSAAKLDAFYLRKNLSE